MIQNIQIKFTYFALKVKNGPKLITKMKNKLHCLGIIIFYIKITILLNFMAINSLILLSKWNIKWIVIMDYINHIFLNSKVSANALNLKLVSYFSVIILD